MRMRIGPKSHDGSSGPVLRMERMVVPYHNSNDNKTEQHEQSQHLQQQSLQNRYHDPTNLWLWLLKRRIMTPCCCCCCYQHRYPMLVLVRPLSIPSGVGDVVPMQVRHDRRCLDTHRHTNMYSIYIYMNIYTSMYHTSPQGTGHQPAPATTTRPVGMLTSLAGMTKHRDSIDTTDRAKNKTTSSLSGKSWIYMRTHTAQTHSRNRNRNPSGLDREREREIT